jgi:hypothetical protein
MTTWHEEETLEDALDYFLDAAYPTDGFAVDSEYWVAISMNNAAWAPIIRRRLEAIVNPSDKS